MSIQHGDIIQHRIGDRIEFAVVDLDYPGSLEFAADGSIEWFRVRQRLETPYMVHADDLVSREQATKERDEAHRRTLNAR